MIESLENNEAVLLMYLADELPADDAAEVRQMLASDASLRLELGRLRIVYDGLNSGLKRLDELDGVPAPQEAGVRRVMRTLRRHMIAGSATVAAPAAKKSLRYPWWVYPSAAAAAVVLAFLTWWGNHPGGSIPSGYDEPSYTRLLHGFPRDDRGHYAESSSDPNVKLADELENTFKTNNDADSALLALRDDAPKLGDLGGDKDE